MRGYLYLLAMLGVLVLIRPDTANAVTKFDQILGIRISQAIAQNVLGSPPLPSLEEKQRSHFTPLVSYVRADVENPTSTATIPSYSGKLQGWTAGAGLTQSSKKNASLYVFGTMSQVNGEVKRTDISFPLGLKNMENFGYNLSAGLSYRLWSEKTFPFVVGVLAGPFVSRFSSEFNLDNGPNYNYKSTSFVYGPMLGAQGLLRIKSFELNPFFLHYFDLSDPCQTYETTAVGERVDPTSAEGCSVDNREIRMEGSFYAYGLNVSLFGLSFGALAKVQKNAELETVIVRNYAVSYTFNY